MMPPSSMILVNRIDIYPATAGRDITGGPTWSYATTPAFAAVPCSVQADGFEEDVSDQRVVQITHYKVDFGPSPRVKPRDKGIWIDNGGTARTLFAEAVRDNAGHNGSFTVRMVERV